MRDYGRRKTSFLKNSGGLYLSNCRMHSYFRVSSAQYNATSYMDNIIQLCALKPPYFAVGTISKSRVSHRWILATVRLQPPPILAVFA